MPSVSCHWAACKLGQPRWAHCETDLFFFGLLATWALRLLALLFFCFLVIKGGYTLGFRGPEKGHLSGETGHGYSGPRQLQLTPM